MDRRSGGEIIAIRRLDYIYIVAYFLRFIFFFEANIIIILIFLSQFRLHNLLGNISLQSGESDYM